MPNPPKVPEAVLLAFWGCIDRGVGTVEEDEYEAALAAALEKYNGLLLTGRALGKAGGYLVQEAEWKISFNGYEEDELRDAFRAAIDSVAEGGDGG